MAAKNNIRRSRSNIAGAGAKPNVDAAAVAMTAQIIVCILILLSARIIKMVNEETFTHLKQEYTTLVGSGVGAGFSDYFSELAGITADFFSAVENIINDLMGREASPNPVPDSHGRLRAEEPAMGGGARSPLNFIAGEFDMLPAPQGSTLAPFLLNARLMPPVSGIISSPFAYRAHPVSGNLDFHNGVDIAAPYGQDILAALPGYVERTGEDNIYGKYVILRHAHNLKTFYAHCSRILVREGMRINQGERIAKVGDTGLATGPHLHFSVIVEGLYADPLHGLKR